MPLKNTPPLRLAWFVWGLGAVFYLMGFFQRVSPAVMTTELMRDFSISAAALGNLSAFYFYSYVAMQIPTGILADTLGPRRLLTAGTLVAGLGTVVFALAQNIHWAYAGRFLIGGSVAVAFVALLKLADSWFPPHRYAMVSGMALFSGIVGAVFAGPPLRLMVNHFSWRSVTLGTALLTFGIGAAIWLFVRDYPHQRGYTDITPPPRSSTTLTLSSVLGGIFKTIACPNIVLLFFIPGGIVGCVLTFSGLWGVPFLTTHHGLPAEQASILTSAVLVAWAVGGPFFGWLSDRMGRRKPIYIAGCALALTGWITGLYIDGLPLSVRASILVATGFCSGCMIISFAFVKESVPPDLAGTVSGVINMGVMLGPMVLQPAVGWMLDHKWQGKTFAGVRIYPLDAYQSGFSLMVAWTALALLLLLFTRETHCRRLASENRNNGIREDDSRSSMDR
ncbi:MAG: MFS transporter [Desulfobacteraceae bacterium]|nr:MFS transporter [Desulfobacteraceae bacterium]